MVNSNKIGGGLPQPPLKHKGAKTMLNTFKAKTIDGKQYITINNKQWPIESLAERGITISPTKGDSDCLIRDGQIVGYLEKETQPTAPKQRNNPHHEAEGRRSMYVTVWDFCCQILGIDKHTTNQADINKVWAKYFEAKNSPEAKQIKAEVQRRRALETIARHSTKKITFRR